MGKYIVTGGSGDIGLCITEKLVRSGHEVIIQYFKSDVENLMHHFEGMPVSFIKMDLSQPLSSNPFERWMTSGIDGLIYAAGSSYFATLQATEDIKMNEQYHIHFYNLVKIVQYILPDLLNAPNGRIIAVCSIWGETGSAMESIYAGMKSAQIGYIKSAAKELAMTNITVNAVTPGIVDGKMTQSLEKDAIVELIDSLPQERLVNKNAISHYIDYLIHPDSRDVTGTVHRINGGWLI